LENPLANLLLILFVVAVAGYYYSGLRARELAVIATRSHCKTLQLQLLDQSVSLRTTRLFANKQAFLAIKREYDFEFTATGDERYRGKISMLNNTPQSIWLQPHRLPEEHSSDTEF